MKPLPCPFCASRDITVARWLRSEWVFACDCDGCGALGPWHKEENGAVELWNSRVAPVPVQTIRVSRESSP